MKKSAKLFERRKERVRFKLKNMKDLKLRLSVFRSSQHIYAQIIDDAAGKVLVSASSVHDSFKEKSGSNKNAAVSVGKLLGEAAKKANIKEVVFDRGGYTYHGRIKALAEAVRETGLKF